MAASLGIVYRSSFRAGTPRFPSQEFERLPDWGAKISLGKARSHNSQSHSLMGSRPSICYARFEMKLPNGERAIVDIRKLQGYCLNSLHSRGRSKARVFASIGIREADADELRTALLAAASDAEARLGVANPYGQRYIVDLDLVRQGRTVRVRSTWIVRIGEDFPRLTSCYVL